MAFFKGELVVNKRNGNKGVVVETCFDGSMHIVFEHDETKTPKKLGPATIKRWYRSLKASMQDVKVRKPSTLPPLPKGEKGIGFELRAVFDSLVKSNIPEGDEFDKRYNPKSSTWVYRLNGKNIFECTESKYRFSVLLSPKALAPGLKSQAYTIYPKERNWSLSARYVFISKEQRPLMKQVVLAGIYSKSNRK